MTFVEPIVIVADLQINQSQLKARTCSRRETRENEFKRLSIVIYVFNVASFQKISQDFMSMARNRNGGCIIIMVNVEMYCTSKFLLSIFQVESCWTIARISSTFSWFEVRFLKMLQSIMIRKDSEKCSSVAKQESNRMTSRFLVSDHCPCSYNLDALSL